MIYFTSDCHFSHDKEFLWGPRGFKNQEEMNDEIVKRWNEVVQPEDEVYHLGDVMLGNNGVGMENLKKLNGKIHIIFGNHDTEARKQLYAECPSVDILGYATQIKYGKYHFYLSHYPTLTSNMDNGAPLRQHILNLYGHTHQKTNFYNEIPFMYHVGMDSHDCRPVSADQVIEDIKSKVEEYKALTVHKD